MQWHLQAHQIELLGSAVCLTGDSLSMSHAIEIENWDGTRPLIHPLQNPGGTPVRFWFEECWRKLLRMPGPWKESAAAPASRKEQLLRPIKVKPTSSSAAMPRLPLRVHLCWYQWRCHVGHLWLMRLMRLCNPNASCSRSCQCPRPILYVLWPIYLLVLPVGTGAESRCAGAP